MMALKKCKECGKDYSDTADACPHCGHKPYKPSGCLTIILAGVVILIIGNVATSCNSPPQKTPAQIEQDTRGAAVGACRQAILLTLNDPGSAEFVGLSTEAYASRQTDQSWIIQRKVRAKNAFGAYRLAVFECHVAPNGDGTWRGLNVKQLSP